MNSFILISHAYPASTSYLAATPADCRDASDLAAFEACKAACSSITMGKTTAQPCRTYPPTSPTLALCCATYRDKVEYRVTDDAHGKHAELGFPNFDGTAWIVLGIGKGRDTAEAMRRAKDHFVNDFGNPVMNEDAQMLGE